MFVIGVYNRLVQFRNRFKNAYAQIDVQFKRRYDLIPNLVEAVKGYMQHEKGTLEAVIEARNSAFGASKAAADSPGDPSAMQKLGQAEGQLNGALGRLFALSEAYPDLKANQNMLVAPGGAGLDREQGRVLPPGVQRRGDAVQHPPRDVPRHRRRQLPQLHRGQALRGRLGEGEAGPEGVVRLSGIDAASLACRPSFHRRAW